MPAQTVLAETPCFTALLGTCKGKGMLLIATIESSIAQNKNAVHLA